ncbi:MAG: nucleotide-binding protein [Methanoregulaceae archaeon]|nr:nucleotide-binding protein [Methanoregulaceae archaeon]
MIERFSGSEGMQALVEQLCDQTLVNGDRILAQALAEAGSLHEFPTGSTIIEQGAHDTDVHFIVAGRCGIIVNGRTLPVQRRAGTHVGEMAAIQPSQTRSATVVADECTVTLSVSLTVFCALAAKHPNIWRLVAKELSRRLIQRNELVTATHEKIRVFIMSSAESLAIARALQNGLAHDPFLVTIWTDGVFRASSYPIESLEAQVEESDFAIAIAHGDDKTEVRGITWPSPRDNVVFELGFFMGRLGRERALLVEARGEEVKLPSDLAGLTTISYKWSGDSKELPAAIGPVCNRLRDIITDLGPNN